MHGEYSSQCKKNNFMLNAGKMNEHLFIKVTVHLPISFEKKILTKQDIASTEISYQFLAPKVPLLRRNKATNSSTSTDRFSAATKTFVLRISQFHLRWASQALAETTARLASVAHFIFLLSP